MPSRQLLIATVMLLGAAALAGHFGLATQESNQAKTEQDEKEPVTDEAIRNLIKQLGDNSYERRESAFKRLAAIGEPALELLEKEARESKDAEVRQRVNVLRSGIVPSRFIFISLMPKANMKLADSFGSGALEGNNLAKLPTGKQNFGRKAFQIENGVIDLSGTKTKDKPAKVEGIKVDQKLAKLHILHGTCFGQGMPGDLYYVADDTLIGEYKIHYDDKTTVVIPIVYGKDVRDWIGDDPKGTTRGILGWHGSSDFAGEGGVRLYVASWENPSPDKLVREIDYHSTNTLCSPFCVAMSAGLQKEVAWRFKGEPAAREFSGAIVADDVVFVCSSLRDELPPGYVGILRALRATDAKEMWKHESQGRFHGRPCYDEDQVYFISDRGIAAVSRRNGQPRWSRNFEHSPGECVVLPAKGLVFVGAGDGFVYALDTKKGEVKWQANIVADAPPDPPGFPGKNARFMEIVARPNGIACDGEMVYQNIFDQSRVVAIDVATGKLRWSYQTGGWLSAAPAFSSDHALVGGQDKFVHCLDRRTGKLVWKFETGHRNGSTPVVEGRSVYFGSDNGGVFRVNLADGKQIWKFVTDPDYTGRRFISSAPLLIKDTLYIATCEGQVYALNKETGELRWKLRASESSQITSSIVSDGRRLFVATREDWDKRGEPSLVAISVK